MGKLKRAFLVAAALLFGFIGVNVQPVQAYSGMQIIPDSDVHYLTETDIADMNEQLLCYAKNEIYARRGRTFESDELQGYFNMQSWYYGYLSPSQFSDDVFNDVELKNIALLTDREMHVWQGGYQLDSGYYSYKPVFNYVNENQAESENSTSNATGYIIPGSDSRYLTSSEISDMTPQLLCYAKNEIYARRGRTFVSRELQEYFNQQSWYNGTVAAADFSEHVFNAYEMSNVELLTEREMALVSGGYKLDMAGYSYTPVYDYIGWGAHASDSTFIFADSDVRYLTVAEIQSLSMQMACYAKNEIYARRGRMFESKELQDFFNSKTWYTGMYSPEEFNDNIFNVYENTNIKALTDYEFSLNPAGYQLY